MKITDYPFSYRTKFLKNGACHPLYKIQKAVDHLIELRNTCPEAFLDLVKKSRFASHDLPQHIAALFEERGILRNNEIDDVVKDVVLSSVSGRLLSDIEVTSPIFDGNAPRLLT